MQKPIRQGDILLLPVKTLPAGVEETKERVLARGEATGHSHRIEGGKVLKANNGQLLIELEEPTKLTHEEHPRHDLEEGIYEVRRQREYNPQANRQVND